jgi:nucleoside 2-deoxyribosyltransferase
MYELPGDEEVKGRAALSHAVRQMQRKGRWPLVNAAIIKQILSERTLPKPTEQATNLLLWLGNAAEAGDSQVVVACETLQAIIGGLKVESVYYVIHHLVNMGFIRYDRTDGTKSTPPLWLQMTFQGWEEYERLQHEQVESRTVFMAMKFGVEELNKVVDEVFRPAVAATGFTLRVLTDEPRAGLIDDRLRVEIRRSRFLIADITHSNLGAYWEAGFAEGLGKPVIYTCKGEAFAKGASHFDTNHHLTVMWDDDFQRTAEDLKATIRATFPTEAKLED